MPLKQINPTSPGRRKMSVDSFSDITKSTPEKSLIKMLKSKSGRNIQGKITVRHRGGGVKRLYRVIDFKQDKFDVEGVLQSIEYDPYRNARIALVKYADGEKRYIVAPIGLGVDSKVMSSAHAIAPNIGNRMPLKYIPIGQPVFSVELKPKTSGKIARSAGGAAKFLAIEAGLAHLQLPSGEMRNVVEDCAATIGQVSNPDFKLIRWGKAGRMRYRGIRPSVRGKAMNPVDHPHGGGEGLSPIGLKHPKTPWGKPALGVKTRKKKKWSNQMIVKRRKNKKKK